MVAMGIQSAFWHVQPEGDHDRDRQGDRTEHREQDYWPGQLDWRGVSGQDCGGRLCFAAAGRPRDAL